MTTILYEHPLNERIRNYLKLEQLFKQADSCVGADIHIFHPIFFNALFSIIDALERSDIRGDLIKDLEKLQQNLVVWSQAPNIDNTALESNLRETVALVSQLRMNCQTWSELKENAFLSSLKQRFAIQGGSCSFDLPQLQFWLHQPELSITKDIELWLSFLKNIKGTMVKVYCYYVFKLLKMLNISQQLVVINFATLFALCCLANNKDVGTLTKQLSFN